ncbi:type IV pilus secretin PilQ [Idiomarina xiamenensis]|nr:type IV pilus secretin PilQ [Idiomarina xiamenensis]
MRHLVSHATRITLLLVIVLCGQTLVSPTLFKRAMAEQTLVMPEWLPSSHWQRAQQRLDLQTRELPLAELLTLLAEHIGLNLMLADGLTAPARISLQHVSWLAAMQGLLDTYQLQARQQQGLVVISRAANTSANQANDNNAPVLPLQNRVLAINFANASALAELIRDNDQHWLSAQGSVSVDQRSNSLLLRDHAQALQDIVELIKQLDKPVRQVTITARMVTIRDNVAEELGIRWGSPHLTGANSSQSQQDSSDTSDDGQVASRQHLNINLPVSQPAASLGLRVAKFGQGRLLDLELTALERESKGEIIASPRITTANQQAAYIEQGTEIPYVESAASGATSVQFKKAVMGLTVTPHITPDDHVILDLVITQNTRGDTVSTPTGPAVAIETQEMGTQVLVKNGETLVLGGIYQQQQLDDRSQVPILADLPLIGRFFRHTNQIVEKRELLIFVTPQLVDKATKDQQPMNIKTSSNELDQGHFERLLTQ